MTAALHGAYRHALERLGRLDRLDRLDRQLYAAAALDALRVAPPLRE